MAYRMTTAADHSDLAGGFVLRSAPGHPAFPVRLAEELFLRAAAHLPDRPLTLWDPCCGSGHLATVLGLLHRPRLARVICSDANPDAVALAERNLALLTAAGLAEREAELRSRAAEFGKPGYATAADAAHRLAVRMTADLPSTASVGDAFDPAPCPADLVLTDVPYGEQTSWLGAAPEQPIAALARALCRVLPGHAVVVLCARARKVDVGAPALERVRLGTRAAFLGRVADLRRQWA